MVKKGEKSEITVVANVWKSKREGDRMVQAQKA